MKLENSTNYLILCWLCMASSASFANSEVDKTDATEKPSMEASEQHAAHLHGVAKLMLATGGDGMEIMLETPAMNVVGFEHVATTDDEHKAVAEARRKLESGDQLFEMNPEAGCSLLSADVTSSLFESKDADSKDADKKLPDTIDTEHRDVDASWSFSCAKPEALKNISTLLFQAFPGLEKLDAEWITESGGSALEMDKDTTIVLSQ